MVKSICHESTVNMSFGYKCKFMRDTWPQINNIKRHSFAKYISFKMFKC